MDKRKTGKIQHPAKPPSRLKEQLVQIRLTTEQRQKFQQAADRLGLDLSSWIRMVCLKATESGD